MDFSKMEYCDEITLSDFVLPNGDGKWNFYPKVKVYFDKKSRIYYQVHHASNHYRKTQPLKDDSDIGKYEATFSKF